MKRFILAMMVSCLMITPWMADAAVPQMVPYQGQLSDAAGTQVNGVVNITFSLYTIASGGAPIWSETHTGVNISKGLFKVDLGSVTSFPVGAFSTPVYLGVTVGADPEMSPRTALTSAPFALHADDADTVGGFTPAQLQGATGPTGPQGPMGLTGLTGAQGPAGPQGLQGVVGATGSAGSPDTGAQILAKLAPVDGAASGLDADKLDGLDASEIIGFAAGATGRIPPGGRTLAIQSLTVGGLGGGDLVVAGSAFTLDGRSVSIESIVIPGPGPAGGYSPQIQGSYSNIILQNLHPSGSPSVFQTWFNLASASPPAIDSRTVSISLAGGVILNMVAAPVSVQRTVVSSAVTMERIELFIVSMSMVDSGLPQGKPKINLNWTVNFTGVSVPSPLLAPFSAASAATLSGDLACTNTTPPTGTQIAACDPVIPTTGYHPSFGNINRNAFFASIYPEIINSITFRTTKPKYDLSITNAGESWVMRACWPSTVRGLEEIPQGTEIMISEVVYTCDNFQ